MEKFVVLDRETNNWEIWIFESLKEAEKCVEENEKEDKINWNFKIDYYEIKSLFK